MGALNFYLLTLATPVSGNHNCHMRDDGWEAGDLFWKKEGNSLVISCGAGGKNKKPVPSYLIKE